MVFLNDGLIGGNEVIVMVMVMVMLMMVIVMVVAMVMVMVMIVMTLMMTPQDLATGTTWTFSLSESAAKPSQNIALCSACGVCCHRLCWPETISEK